jgi:aspartyl-tRNA(Asn)/glutamyl-tRNA(Gln) amidotransferase subunit A
MSKDQEPLTIRDAIAAMRAGVLTPVDLLEQCLARIDRYESLVRAWVVVDRDEAREQARRLTDELARGQVRGPLHGIPVGVKDIIDVFSLPSGCGAARWASCIARRDAECVRRLRAAGAVILGKTVTTAYAYLDPAVTRNPWDPARTPGGSSSGSAAAVACGMCLAALGTQTVGSLTRPASFCGVYSYKPPKGRVDDSGVLPLAPNLDHVGVMARCVGDLAVLANALGADFPDNVEVAESDGPGYELPGESLERAEPAMRSALRRVAGDSQPAEWPAEFAEIPRHLRVILAVEAADLHGEWLKTNPDDYPPRIRALVEEGLGMPLGDYNMARAHQRAACGATDRFFASHPILVTPATIGPAPDRSTTGDGWFNAPWSYTGRPTVSLPVARTDDGLPLAVQLVAEAGGARLFRFAARLERLAGYNVGLPPAPE